MIDLNTLPWQPYEPLEYGEGAEAFHAWVQQVTGFLAPQRLSSEDDETVDDLWISKDADGWLDETGMSRQNQDFRLTPVTILSQSGYWLLETLDHKYMEILRETPLEETLL